MDVSHLKYPIYIVSKGRAERSITANDFMKWGIPFKVAVEPQEYDAYCATLGKQHVAKLPFSNLGVGSYPARNWCWQDSLDKGYEKHFLFDDNIYGFMAFDKGRRRTDPNLNSLLPIITLQEFSERYENLGISGFNYHYFTTKETNKAFFLNTHVYSAMLIRNDLPYRWRLKYNEDVDLCLQALHNGWCTVLMNTYLAKKVSTVAKLKGGNQDELYKGNAFEKKVLKARSLEQIWPQYVRTTMRFNRPHHHVSWGKYFKQPLKRKRNYDKLIKEQAELFNALLRK